MNNIGCTDESSDERRGGPVIDLVSRPDLLHPALMHHDDLVSELKSLLLVVGHQQAGHAKLTVQVVQPPPELLADPSVQGAERLVKQQQPGLRSKRPGECHALTLAARELIRIAVGKRRKANQFKKLADPFALRGLRFPAHGQPEGNVAAHRHVPEQGIVLEHEPKPPLLHALARLLLAADPDAAHIGPLQPCDHAKHGALARATRPEERGDLSVLSLEADVPDRLKRAESLPQPLDDDALAHVPRPFSCLRLKISMPDNMKIDTMASVRATT